MSCRRLNINCVQFIELSRCGAYGVGNECASDTVQARCAHVLFHFRFTLCVYGYTYIRRLLLRRRFFNCAKEAAVVSLAMGILNARQPGHVTGTTVRIAVAHRSHANLSRNTYTTRARCLSLRSIDDEDDILRRSGTRPHYIYYII